MWSWRVRIGADECPRFAAHTGQRDGNPAVAGELQAPAQVLHIDGGASLSYVHRPYVEPAQDLSQPLEVPRE